MGINPKLINRTLHPSSWQSNASMSVYQQQQQQQKKHTNQLQNRPKRFRDIFQDAFKNTSNYEAVNKHQNVNVNINVSMSNVSSKSRGFSFGAGNNNNKNKNKNKSIRNLSIMSKMNHLNASRNNNNYNYNNQNKMQSNYRRATGLPSANNNNLNANNSNNNNANPNKSKQAPRSFGNGFAANLAAGFTVEDFRSGASRRDSGNIHVPGIDDNNHKQNNKNNKRPKQFLSQRDSHSTQFNSNKPIYAPVKQKSGSGNTPYRQNQYGKKTKSYESFGKPHGYGRHENFQNRSSRSRLHQLVPNDECDEDEEI